MVYNNTYRQDTEPWPRRLDVKARRPRRKGSTLLDAKARRLNAEARRLDVT